MSKDGAIDEHLTGSDVTAPVAASRCASTQSQVSLAASEFSAFSAVHSLSSLQVTLVLAKIFQINY